MSAASRRYAVRHRSRYVYQGMVVTSHHLLRLIPRSGPEQACERFRFHCTPEPSHLVEEIDYFGNRRQRCHFATAYRQLDLTTSSVVQVCRQAPRIADSAPWSPILSDPLLQEWVLPSSMVPVGPDYAAYASPSFPEGRPLAEGAADLAARITADFVYDPHATTVTTPVSEVLGCRRGVCQDFAHLMLACLRSLGLPARYVSGYLETVPPSGQQRLSGADASHAWCAVHDPLLGWVDCDPTNGGLVADRHLTLAWGRDFADVSPVTGIVIGGGSHSHTVAVDVVPESEWPQQGIDEVGVFSEERDC